MSVISYIIKDGVYLPEWVMLCYVYGFSNEVICVEVSITCFSEFAWQITTLL